MQLKTIIFFTLTMAIGVCLFSNQVLAMPEAIDNFSEDLNIIIKVEGNPDVSGEISTPANINEVTLTEAGMLRTVLGDELHSIESLAIVGPLNKDDFNTLWESTFYGFLKYLDLAKANLEENKIPDYAFYNQKEQIIYDYENDIKIIKPSKLEHVILPEGITEIGAESFGYAQSLKTINLPNSITIIGDAAFFQCISLSLDPLVLPENIRSFKQAFMGCKSLTGEVIVPESLDEISASAFYDCPINKINIHDNIKCINALAFYGSNLSEVNLADDCVIAVGWGAFWNCQNLKSMHIPQETKVIPEFFCQGCSSLRDIHIPDNVTYISEGAFDGCPLDNLQLPSSMDAILTHAFRGGKINKIHLPTQLQDLFCGAFSDCGNLKEVFCPIPIPPLCTQLHENDANPFARCNPDLIVYVPKGSGDLYRHASGWSKNNIVEMDMSGIELRPNDNTISESISFNLDGKKNTTLQRGQIMIKDGKKIIVK